MEQSTIEISIIQTHDTRTFASTYVVNAFILSLSFSLSLCLSFSLSLYLSPHPCIMQNWIRNRRRPTAVKSAEKFVEKISQGNLPPVPTIPNIPSLPTNMTSMGLSTPSALSSDSSVVMSSAQPSTSNLSSLGRTLATHLSLPEPKRVCTESGMLLS